MFYRNEGSGAYQISIGKNQHINVYCQMTSIAGCHGGGWTLVMKIDGRSVRASVSRSTEKFEGKWQQNVLSSYLKEFKKHCAAVLCKTMFYLGRHS